MVFFLLGFYFDVRDKLGRRWGNKKVLGRRAIYFFLFGMSIMVFLFSCGESVKSIDERHGYNRLCCGLACSSISIHINKHFLFSHF